MKKLFLILACFAGFLFLLKPVAAAEVEEPAITEEQEFEDFKESVTEWLNQYMEESMVIKILTWAVDAGVLGALFCVYIKYKKHKNNTIEDCVNSAHAAVKEKFDDLREKELKDLVDAMKELENGYETIMKVLVLMQDSSTQGKISLIDYLGSKTKSEEVKEATEGTKEVLIEKQETEAVVKEKVSGEYKDIF